MGWQRRRSIQRNANLCTDLIAGDDGDDDDDGCTDPPALSRSAPVQFMVCSIHLGPGELLLLQPTTP